MFSYKEFPEQVEGEMQNFIKEHYFSLKEKREDHCLIYQNHTWELFFYCEHGAIQVSLINLEDGFEYYLYDVIEFWFPDSIYSKKMKNYVWGSLITVKFNVDLLKKYYPIITEKYILDKNTLENIKNPSSLLIHFSQKQGSKELKKIFNWSSYDWMNLASYEYKNYKHLKKKGISNYIFYSFLKLKSNILSKIVLLSKYFDGIKRS